ncbi:MAG TPA: squalene synthase HpnC, partial [Gammaproteobacteria bacterium]|nr:squalene synthase HpnC [Gammaproteobacteria bacterium]
CMDTAHKHYENFPVASLLLPRQSRKHVAALYCFARQADDLADEGDQPDGMRIQALNSMRAELHQCTQGKIPDQPMYRALADTIQRYNLPLVLFDDLISAFNQDVMKHRYTDFDDLLDYCKRSANPVGRLMLHLHRQTDEQSMQQSDALCTALQLINFCQDLQQDYTEMKRIYIPLEDLASHHVTEQHFINAISDDAMHHLMQLQYLRASQFLTQGAKLGKRLHGRFGLEIKLIIAGGQRILHKLNKQKNKFSRPRLNTYDKLWMLKTALLS